MHFTLFAVALLATFAAAQDLAARFRNPPADMTRPLGAFVLKGGSEEDRLMAERQLERVKELGAGGAVVALPGSSREVWENWRTIVRRAARSNLELVLRDFPETNRSFASHLDNALRENQKLPDDIYGKALEVIYFGKLSLAEMSAARDLVQEAGMKVGVGAFTLPVPPEEASVYFRRASLQENARNKTLFEATWCEDGPPDYRAIRKAERRERFNRRVGGGARACWREQIWGTLLLKQFYDGWKKHAAGLFCCGANRIVLDTVEGLPSDDRTFRALREDIATLHRTQVLLQSGRPVADFLYWTGTLDDPWPFSASCDAANKAMLGTARAENKTLRFPSSSGYKRIVVAPSVASDKLSRNLAERFKRQGIEVNTWPDLPPVDFEATLADGAEAPIRFCHRKADGREIYFLANQSQNAVAATLYFRDAPARPELWHPATGAIKTLENIATIAEGTCTFPMVFKPHEFFFVVF